MGFVLVVPNIMFQSSPAQMSGRNDMPATTPGYRCLFQSSPAQMSGRNSDFLTFFG